MKSLLIRNLVLLLLLICSNPSFAGKKSEYGDIIKKTPEYKEITRDRKDDDRDDYYRHDPYYYYPYHYHYPVYPPAYAGYDYSEGSESVGLPGLFYLGIAIGESQFNYDDIDDGDARIFHFGYRPEDSYLGYEMSFYNSGDSEVTSLTGIELEVESINLAIRFNIPLKSEAFDLFVQGGIYFADTTLSGPSGRVSESSNGFMAAVGVEAWLNRHFNLRAAFYQLDEVEDFANDESITFFVLGGQFVF